MSMPWQSPFASVMLPSIRCSIPSGSVCPHCALCIVQHTLAHVSVLRPGPEAHAQPPPFTKLATPSSGPGPGNFLAPPSMCAK